MNCQYVYLNLLHCHLARESVNITASGYVREFLETSDCDSTGKDLSILRKEYIDYVNTGDSERMSRIMTFQQTGVDEEIAAKAFIHYNKMHKDQLISTLSVKNWFKYHCDFKCRN